LKDYLWLLVILMAAVTFIPRVLPMVSLQHVKLPRFLKRQFEFVPYAALSALIFPGILTSTGRWDSAVAGALAAIALTLGRLNLFFVVIGSIAAVFVWQAIM
jgi:branched-subunit amino acid transport protein